MRRTAAEVLLVGPPAPKPLTMLLDWSKKGEPRTPTGEPRFTLLKILRALTLKVRL